MSGQHDGVFILGGERLRNRPTRCNVHGISQKLPKTREENGTKYPLGQKSVQSTWCEFRRSKTRM